MRIPQNNLALHFNYHINNELIREVHHVKYLGITIDSHLTWREHVNVLSHKANATLVLLRCNLKPCSLHIKSKSYLCYVRPMVEYSSTVWDPHIKEDIHKIEMIQRRAARFVFNNYDLIDSVTTHEYAAVFKMAYPGGKEKISKANFDV